MFSFAMLGHWFACVWYVIGYEEFQRKEINGWLHGLGIVQTKFSYGHSMAVIVKLLTRYFSQERQFLTSM